MTSESTQLPDRKRSETAPKRRRADGLLPASWRLMRIEVEAIRDYIETVDSVFKERFNKFHARATEVAESPPERAKEAFWEREAETGFNLTEHFPQLTWQSTFVAIYSFLEDEMLGIARVLGRRLKIRLDPDDLRHEGIHAARKYIEDLCAIAFPERKHPWQEALHYNRLRNAIVHCRGHLKRAKSAATIEKYVEDRKSLSMDSLKRLQLSKEFCLESLENVEALLEELFELARERLR